MTVISLKEDSSAKGIQEPETLRINAACVSHMNNGQCYAFQMTETPIHLIAVFDTYCLPSHGWLLSKERKETQVSPYPQVYKAAGLNTPRPWEC